MPAIRCSCGSLCSSALKACKKCGAAIAAPVPVASGKTPVSEKVPARECPDCAEMATGKAICEWCGCKLPVARRCPDCAEITSRTICEFCGYNRNAKAREAWDQHAKAVRQHEVVDAVFGHSIAGQIVRSQLPEASATKAYFKGRQARKG